MIIRRTVKIKHRLNKYGNGNGMKMVKVVLSTWWFLFIPVLRLERINEI